MEVLSIKDVLARDFYAEMCRIERWDVRTLRQKIAGMLFERTALSKNTREVISSEIAILRDGLQPALTRRAIRCRTLRCSRIGRRAWSSPGVDTPGYAMSHLAVLENRERRLPDDRQSRHAQPQGPSTTRCSRDDWTAASSTRTTSRASSAVTASSARPSMTSAIFR